jgi:hypothetical protein
VIGVAYGISWASSSPEVDIYCQPKKLSLSGLNYLSILDGFLEEHPSDVVDTIEFVEPAMLRALIDIFPCPKE